MRLPWMLAPVLLAASASGGCMTDDFVRTEGVTSAAGEAIAANTVMQMVDPWPAGVQDTDLAVPADVGQHRRGQAEASGATSENDSSVVGG